METKRETPETDAFYRPEFQTYPAANFARKLERERDEALEALSGRTVSCERCNEMADRIDELEGRSVHSCGDHCKRAACVKRREREAEISRLKQELSKMTASADALYGCIKDIDDLTYHELDCLKKHEVLTGKPLSFG